MLSAACSGEPAATPAPPTRTPAPTPTATPRADPAADNQPARLTIPSWLDWSDAFPGSDAAPPEGPLDQAGGSHGFSHYVLEEVGGRVVTTLVEGPREEQVRVPISYAELKELHAERGPFGSGPDVTGRAGNPGTAA